MTENDIMLKLQSLETRVGTLETGQEHHKGILESIKEDTVASREVFDALRGFWKVLEFIGKAAKPFAVVAGLFGAWFAFKSGVIK